MSATTDDLAAESSVPAETLTDPAAAAERIPALDVLRGFALLGILAVNIEDFGRPFDNHRDVLAGDWTNINRIAWAVVSVFYEGKMRAVFSMLFGAGVVLFTSRIEQRAGGGRAADLYFRRTLWLLAIGLVHSYFIWSGDILVYYGLSGLFLYSFRNLRPAILIALGVVVLAFSVPQAAIVGERLDRLRQDAADADAQQQAGKELTKEQRDAQEAWQEAHPNDKDIAKIIEVHRGGYWNLLVHRFSKVPKDQPTVHFDSLFFDSAGMMLIGMGLFRLGFLSGALADRTYWIVAAVGLALGISLRSAIVYTEFSRGFDPMTGAWFEVKYHGSRLASSLAYISLVLLAVRNGIAPKLLRSLAAVGRMALTNYLGTSVFCTFIFYGYGLGLYASLARYQLLFLMAMIWVAQLVLSPLWLHFFQFGPVEWLWRSLTYAKVQPFRQPES